MPWRRREQMVQRVMTNLERLPRDIDRYMLLSALQERNERLFYQTVIAHIERILPLIYTPTVGEACREFSHIAREPKGFFITPGGSRTHPPDPGQLAAARHPRHRRHRRTAHPGPRRPGRQRHGHSDRKTGDLHRLRRHRSERVPAGDARRRDQQRGTAERRAVSRLSAAEARRQGVFRSRRGVRDRRAVALSGCADPVRGFPDAERVRAAEQVPGARALLQRRHPGHGGRGPGRRVLLDAHHRRAVQGSADHVPRRRFGGHGDRRSDDRGVRGRRPRSRRSPAPAVVRGRERPGGEGAHGPDGAQPVRTRTTTRRSASSRRSMRSGRTCSSAPPALRGRSRRR